MASGLHTGWDDTTRVLSCLKNAGYTFIGRYIFDSNTSGIVAMTPTEATNISNAGMYVVTVWENGHANSSNYFSYAQGKDDGYWAFMSAANDFAQPTGTPVYFAVDFDALPAHQTAIESYFTGVHDGYLAYLADQNKYGNPQITYRIGVYGSYDVLSWCQAQGIATYFWQAYAPAWSSYRNTNAWPGYNLRQTSGDVPVCSGFQIDPDTSSTLGGGGWKY